MTAILSVNQLTKSFGAIRVLNRISFAIEPTEHVVALTGPNAAGKTTLFNILGGIDTPDPGVANCVTLFGEPIQGRPTWQIARRGMARLFQDARVFQNLTLLENVQLAAQHPSGSTRLKPNRSSDADAESQAALDLVGLASDPRVPARLLSLGERRKLALACMFRTGAPLLLLDEPTANLDEATTVALKAIIVEIAARGRYIMLIEHNDAFIQAVASVVLHLHQGHLSRVTVPPTAFTTGDHT